MHQLVTSFRYLLATVGTLALLLTFLSVGPAPVWWLQVLDFPRFQLLVLHALVLVGLLLLGARHQRATRLLLLGTGAGLALQAYFILPLTVLGQKTVPDADSAAANAPGTVRLSVLVANVYMRNRQAELLRQLVRATKPDVLLALETDAWWTQALRPLQDGYPHRVELPLDNSYGLVLYSRLPLVEPQIKYLQQPHVPSIHAGLRLPDGRVVAFHGVHPTPPVPHYYPSSVGYEDVELLKVGKMVARQPQPSIVAGDFNDVSWSHTTRMFEADGALRNVRSGRGLFNSFNATSFLMRWPLDHIFVTKHFRLAELKRLSDINSDHFPVYAELVLDAPANSAPGQERARPVGH